MIIIDISYNALIISIYLINMKIAIIGASADISKFGNKILRNLHKKWHYILPVNPKENEIEGIKCFNNIDNLPKDVEVLNFVTPPKITLEILKRANILGFKNVWCQPWSSDNEVKAYLEENGFKYIVDACIMMSN